MARTVKAPDERRSELITAAQKLFYTKGYKSTSVSDIVKAVGVAQGTFYYYFDSKTAILEAMVHAFAAQSAALIQAIADDKSLTALEKWHKAFAAIGQFKWDQKDEYLAMISMVYNDENVMLRYKNETAQGEYFIPILTQIVEQGVNEGVFSTNYPAEAAAIAFSPPPVIIDAIFDVFFHPESYENHAAEVVRKYAAIQEAVERILGVEPGSLPLANEAEIARWFEE